MRVRWTLPASEQLEEIFRYIARDNPGAAYRTVQRIRAAIRKKALMPYSGRIGRIADTREVFVIGTSYLVAYRIYAQEGFIQVLAIRHGKQEWPESL